MADRYFVDTALSLGPVEVTGPEAQHLAVVCRVRRGDAVCLFNGDGREYPARVVETGKRRVTLEVTAVESPARELGFRLEAAAPLPKGDRAQFLLEKLTELGAASFTPLHTTRSVVHPRDAKLDKLRRHVIEASKQCGRNVLLEVRPLTDWKTFCESPALPAIRLLAHPNAERGVRNAECGDVVFAVGPEGGFTEEEVAQAVATGWRTVSLGPRILRVETAALALAAAFALPPLLPSPRSTGERGASHCYTPALVQQHSSVTIAHIRIPLPSGVPLMKRWLSCVFGVLLLLGPLSPVRGNEGPPPRPAQPKAAKLVVVVDERVKEPHLVIPRSLMGDKKSAWLETPTVVAGLALTFALVSGGVWLVRRGTTRTVAAVILALSVLAFGATALLADVAKPPPPKVTPVTLPANVVLSEKIQVEFVDKGDEIKLLVGKGMVKTEAKPEAKPEKRSESSDE